MNCAGEDQLLHYSTSYCITKRGALSLVSTIKELLGKKNNGSGLKNREYGCWDLLRWTRDTFYPQKMALTSPTKGGRSVCMVLSRTKTTGFLLLLLLLLLYYKTEGPILVTWLSWLPGEWRTGSSCCPKAMREQSCITEQAEQAKCACCLPLKLVEQGLAVMKEDSDLDSKHSHDTLTGRQGTWLLRQ
jgi:hypothetical protein